MKRKILKNKCVMLSWELHWKQRFFVWLLLCSVWDKLFSFSLSLLLSGLFFCRVDVCSIAHNLQPILSKLLLLSKSKQIVIWLGNLNPHTRSLLQSYKVCQLTCKENYLTGFYAQRIIWLVSMQSKLFDWFLCKANYLTGFYAEQII